MADIRDIKTKATIGSETFSLPEPARDFVNDLRNFADMVERGQRLVPSGKGFLVYLNGDGYVCTYVVGTPQERIETVGMLELAKNTVIEDG